MVKVLRIITRLNIGGPAIHAILLSSSLNDGGVYKNILVTGSVSESEGDMADFARSKGIDPIVIPGLTREISIKNDFRAFRDIYRLIRKERPDIVHTHMAKAGTLGRFAAIIAGVPVKVHTFHGHVFDGYFNPVKANIFVLIEKLLALFTDKVIMVSERVRADIVNRLKVVSESKSVVIPLGLELDRFAACESEKGSFRKRLGVSPDTLLVGIVGRLVPIKNHRMFLEAAAEMKNSPLWPRVKFVVVGDGEMRGNIEDYAEKLGIKDRLILTGWIEDLAPVYADLDVVALTSLNEGTPVSLIEAMASGRAVISTDVGGVRDLIEDGMNGLLVKSGDAASLSDRLTSLLMDDKLRTELGAKGRGFVINRFSKERLAKDIGLLYGDLIAGKTIK
ncbi:MAG: glycosyltransferase family 4 protein [Candidatus Omnitrophica bacterium]|nr:glycosyltransferase family 4 protein [Candidatus Omnitrophota bacterium]